MSAPLISDDALGASLGAAVALGAGFGFRPGFFLRFALGARFGFLARPFHRFGVNRMDSKVHHCSIVMHASLSVWRISAMTFKE